MNDIIQEVTDDIKTEKFFNIVKKFTKMFLVVALIIILITVIIVYKNHKYEQKQFIFSTDYYKLVNTNSAEAEYKNIYDKLAESNSEAYEPMAGLVYARSLLAEHKHQEAFKLLGNIAGDKSNNITFKNIAKIMLMSTVLTQAIKDYPLDGGIGKVSENEPFYGTIKLLYGQILLRDKKDTEAKAVLTELLKDNNVLENVSFLARVLINNIK